MQAPQRLGRFENLTRIAEGGQATVFRARDSATGETVAVKVLHDGPAFSSEPCLAQQLAGQCRRISWRSVRKAVVRQVEVLGRTAIIIR
jgi:serine/threonine protein kinase